MSSAKIPITPGEPISRQMPSSLVGLADAKEWVDFCDAYDNIVAVPFQRAKMTIAGSFLVQLCILMGTMTMTESLPTGMLFLLGPVGFLAVVAAVMLYLFRALYPRAIERLDTLCHQINTRLSNRHIAFQYQHNDARRDIADDFIEISPVVDTEMGFPSTTAEWNPLLQLKKLWNRSQRP